MPGKRYDLSFVPGKRFDLVLRYRMISTHVPMPLAGWTPVASIDQDGDTVWTSTGPEQSFIFEKDQLEEGRINLSLGFDFTDQFYRPYGAEPIWSWWSELVDDTLGENTVDLAYGSIILLGRQP
jgi:hypothetical protein